MKTPEHQLINDILDTLDEEVDSCIEAMNSVTDGSEKLHEGRAELATQLYNWIFQRAWKIPAIKEGIINE